MVTGEVRIIGAGPARRFSTRGPSPEFSSVAKLLNDRTHVWAFQRVPSHDRQLVPEVGVEPTCPVKGAGF